ncbi:DNA cytosine methyltransferase [Helicobacter pullorum]|uniref:DNA cytosine methyltransferase n=1 Tax=Helicobacter pullorum TaxID=35818 RepID=UPI00211C1B8F|nr:DNA cytosine methyltransferase [Helicobacter pullorum]
MAVISYGLKQVGFDIIAGYDLDKTCKYAYEKNINASFITKNIKDISLQEIQEHFKKARYRILVGCAPCQTFSQYTQQSKQKIKNRDDEKWTLLNEFLRIIVGIQPDIISLENVPNLVKYPIFENFISILEEQGYFIDYKIIFCPDYGIPQNRRRLVLLGSKIKEIQIIKKTHCKDNYITVKDAIGFLPKIKSGEQSKTDPLHIAKPLSSLNLERIKATPKNGGSWKDWPEHLILKCHKKESGKNFGSVYGRMKWEEPSPTMTTFCTSLGNGRFGHPEQNRAISLREASLLQTFPIDYDFIDDNIGVQTTVTSRHIGNAVPPRLGEIIGISIKKHLIGEAYG